MRCLIYQILLVSLTSGAKSCSYVGLYDTSLVFRSILNKLVSGSYWKLHFQITPTQTHTFPCLVSHGRCDVHGELFPQRGEDFGRLLVVDIWSIFLASLSTGPIFNERKGFRHFSLREHVFKVNERKRFYKPRLLPCHYSYPNKKMSSLLARLRPSLSHASRHSRAWILAASYHEKVSKRFASLHSICKECELLQSLFTF